MSALQSEVNDAAEWGEPRMDIAFGFHKIAKHCYGPGASLSPMANRSRYDELLANLQVIVRTAAEVENSRLPSEFTTTNAIAMEELETEYGVVFESLPDDVLLRWFEVSAEVNVDACSGGDINRRIYDSWSRFHARAIALAPLSTLGFMQSRGV